MDERTKQLKGSPSRDAFKLWHKTLDSSFYACDLDFVLVVHRPIARICAIIDYKRSGDTVSWAEILAYNNLTDAGWPVYLVNTEPSEPPYLTFSVRQYISGDWRCKPPKVETQLWISN